MASSSTLPPQSTPSLSPVDRSVTFEAVVNVRDLGGLNTRTGRVRRGCLYRAATLHRSTLADADLFNRLGVRTVLDLRTDVERARWSGHGAWRPVTVVHAPLLRKPWDRDDVRADHDAALFLASRYLEILEGSGPVIASVLETIANVDGHAAVFHCAAGKDRTGIIAAVILGLLGVDDATIIDDYHHTAMAMQDLYSLFASDASEQGISMVDQPAAFLASPPEAMELVLRAVRLDFGSMNDYVCSIGVDPIVVEQLRANLVVTR